MKYAVAKEAGPTERYNFRKWHETLDEAKEEARRLCGIEKTAFIVLQKIGTFDFEELPIKWQES